MQHSRSSLATLISVFFFWGFLAASNGIFIPFCKTHFNLTQFQSQLIDSAFYGAYFIGSLILYLVSLQLNKDIINRIGYKGTIIYGLLISIAGAITMIPAVNSGSFAFILAAFFIIALGFSLQQTSANPLVLNLGNPATGSFRLNFAGSVNSLGTTIGPILVSLILFGKVIATDADKASASINSINILYVFLVLAFGVAVVILSLTKIPRLDVEKDEPVMKTLRQPMDIIKGLLIFLIAVFSWFTWANYAESENITEEFYFLAGFTLFMVFMLTWLFVVARIVKKSDRLDTGRYPQVTWGMLAIFVYVGVEVTIQSNFGALLKTEPFGGLEDSQMGPFISLYWGSLMIGRWTGALGAFKLSRNQRILLTIIIPFLAFSLIMFMNSLSGADVSMFYYYPVCIAILIAAFLLARERPAFTLMLFGLLGAAAMVVGLTNTGTVSIYAFLSGGLFCSIMWPSIFSLAIAGLGKYTSQASAFLIMMILGGAFIPPLQGLIADKINIHFSYIITVFCFAYLALYAWRVKAILNKQGINYDKPETQG